MKNNLQHAFTEASRKKVTDKEHYQRIASSVSHYNLAVINNQKQFLNIELARKRAAYIKWKVLENLDKYLIEFEANFTKRGGKIIWALNKEEANKEILNIINKTNAKKVIKSKSITTEELNLNEVLAQQQIEAIETDLGEYIQQLAGELSYHPVIPAIHKSKEEVARLFNEKFKLSKDSEPEDIANFVSATLREDFSKAEVSITGANFLIADMGALAVTENEGNAVLSMAFPKIQIVVSGIEKILPSLADLELFWSLLSTYGTGQKLTTYNSILSGPRQNDESDGPKEMYLVLLDNGRSNLLTQQEQRQALSCIRCGACLNACPVYNHIGGHAYGSTYVGPIGSVISPHLQKLNDLKHLSYASSICGKCTDVCPVHIDIHKLLLYNRRDIITKGFSTKTEKWIYYFWKKAMLKRENMNKGGAKAKDFLLNKFFKKSWGADRELPKIASKSFNEMWREKHTEIM